MNKTNIIIAVVVHAILLFVIVFFASKEGMLGTKMKALTVALVPKEKQTEVVKPKVEPPKSEIQQPTATTPKVDVVQQNNTPKINAAPPPAAVPPSVEMPSFQFSDGAKEVKNISDPIELYKNYIEYSFKSQWKRLDNINDEGYVALIELTIDNKGKVVDNKWLSGSGDIRWDSSVKEVFDKIKSLSRPPPKGFPTTFQVKFDTTIE